MAKQRVVTSKGVVKESSKMIKQRETAREGEEWPEQPSSKEVSIDQKAVKDARKKSRKKAAKKSRG